MNRAFGWLAAILAVAGCATLTTRVDFDRAHDFGGYRTFAWMDDDPVVHSRGETARASALNRRRIVEAIEKELTSKGYTRVAQRTAADFVVDYTVGARDRIEIDSYPLEFRGRWGWGWPYYWRDVDVRTYTEGRLAIDVFDGKTRQPVWHGLARKRISEADVENAAVEIPKAVRTLLARFPP
jgi:hypothetical protein